MKSDDPGVRPVREARERMSREFGHDPRRFLAHLIREQAKTPQRILDARPPERKRRTRREKASGKSK
jgi:hypothetical protein